jgi:hypothetical protein
MSVPAVIYFFFSFTSFGTIRRVVGLFYIHQKSDEDMVVCVTIIIM